MISSYYFPVNGSNSKTRQKYTPANKRVKRDPDSGWIFRWLDGESSSIGGYLGAGFSPHKRDVSRWPQSAQHHRGSREVRTGALSDRATHSPHISAACVRILERERADERVCSSHECDTPRYPGHRQLVQRDLRNGSAVGCVVSVISTRNPSRARQAGVAHPRREIPHMHPVAAGVLQCFR